MVFRRGSHHLKVFWNIRHIHRKKCQAEFFSLRCRPLTLVKKVLMNKHFSVNDCKHLWTSASYLGKYLTTLIIIFDSVENIWNFGLWSNMTIVLEHDVTWESCFSKTFQLMSRIFKLGLGCLGWQRGLFELSVLSS